MADDLSDFPLMDTPTLDIPNDFSDWSSDTINLGGDTSLWGSIWDAIGSPTAKSLLSIGSGLYGLYESGQQKNLAKDAIKAGDPFGPYRQQYAQQLMSLMANPSSITEDPGYQFQKSQGEQAVTRNMASKGYLGSGNLGIALTEYGQNYAQNAYNSKVNQLAGLAGANISANSGPGLQAYNQGLDTASASLASLGYGITRSGASAGTPSSGPNAAGGEAAKIGTGLSAVSAGAKLAGLAGLGDKGTTSSIASTAGGLASIATGVAKGGIAGYGQAATGAASLAGIDTAGWGGIISAGADVAKGNYAGAGVDLAGVALGSPIAGIGFAAAGLLNKAFTANGSKDRNVAAYSQATGAKSVTLPMGHMGVSYWNVGGKLVDTKTFNDLAGSWYGATFAPDGNQSDWEQKYQTALQNVPEVTLPKGWVWNGTNLVRG